MKKNSEFLMETKKYLLFVLINLSLIPFIHCIAQCSNVKISMNDIFIPGIITIGSYSQLIESQGCPNSRFNSTVNPINERCIRECGYVLPENVIQCEYLVYDAFEYVRIGDSVQLVFMDLRKTKLPIFINDFVIDKTVNQKEFLSEIKKRGWWSNESDKFKIGKIESHYCTYTDVNCFYLDYIEDPYSSVIFTFYNTFFNKNIWWIEFPIMRIDGIVH